MAQDPRDRHDDVRLLLEPEGGEVPEVVEDNTSLVPIRELRGLASPLEERRTLNQTIQEVTC